MLTNINHSDLIDNLPKGGEEWKVIYSKSRSEKKVAEYCFSESIRFYLPLEKRIRLYGRKKVETTVPLFPGYIFCQINEKERYQLLLTHQVAKILKISDPLKFLEDIKKIFLAENADIGLIPCEPDIKGRMARIESGPMRGLEGIISWMKGRDRIILNVNFINRAAAVEIDRTDITLLN